MAALVLALTLPTGSLASHQGCNVPVADATEAGAFYIVGLGRSLFEETNGVPGLQSERYGCPGHGELLPADTCYFNDEQWSSTVCPFQTVSRWLG